MKDNISVAETPRTERTANGTNTTVVRSTSPATNGVKLVGEAFVPGASLLMDGNVVNGAAHVAAGIGIKMLFGPVGLLLAAADSYSKSVTDKYLWDHVGDLVNKAKENRKAKAEAASPPAD
ncbi:hypothetical protein BGLT_02668 [Caballeronia glathei]|uniref:Uncharacterized protein n=1 Tax=Caballeronia glathei TaxID=60547 RepID=A0A069PFL6_9BURK|nr:DUF6072 family protein [Caballeronia glathei]KDR39385.1 hypothetical protein BG61_33260 [Caballeronia glathei]CDY73251.1 hypothetical protein BGLT_02668 [Caballeronia glathei]